MNFVETEKLELKKSTAELRTAVVSIVSILNKHGDGELYFGIKNDGSVVGQDISERTIREISQAIAENIEPKIYPEINRVRFQEKECVHVKFEGGEKPYYAYGRPFIRVGDEDRKLSAGELEKLVLDKHLERLKWDTRVCAKAALEDIDERKIRKFLKKAGLRFSTMENVLTKLGLMENGRLLNAAVILFGKKPEDFFPNARLRGAVFAGTGTALVVDMKDFFGDLFLLIEEAVQYVLKNIYVGMELDGLYRVDVPEIVVEAAREAIVNAFCHRDYSQYDSVNIAIFSDRVEIRSPGGLIEGLTIERIKREPVSKRRNELLADMFHRVHFVEKWGRGIELILEHEPSADFKEVADIFVTTFQRKIYRPDPGVSYVGEPTPVYGKKRAKIPARRKVRKKISKE